MSLRLGEPVYDITIEAESYTHRLYVKHLDQTPEWVQKRLIMGLAVQENDQPAHIRGAVFIDAPYTAPVVNSRNSDPIGEFKIYPTVVYVSGYKS